MRGEVVRGEEAPDSCGITVAVRGKGAEGIFSPYIAECRKSPYTAASADVFELACATCTFQIFLFVSESVQHFV